MLPETAIWQGYLLYWYEPRLPIGTALLPPRDNSPSIVEHHAHIVEHIETARRIPAENTQRAQQKMKQLRGRHEVSPSFTVGDEVWVYSPKKQKGLCEKVNPQLPQTVQDCWIPFARTLYSLSNG